VQPVLAAVLAAGLLSGGAGVAVAGSGPSLSAHGPTAVSGTEESAVFRVGDRTIRQVRYADRETLVYSFALENEGRLPVAVHGLAPLERTPRLFEYVELTDAEGHEEFTIGAGERTTVRLSMLMHGCETLSARAGSFATALSVRTERAGMLDEVVTVSLPEEVHTGSPREAFCPGATATSRPPG
jgi:hypothetical protein